MVLYTHVVVKNHGDHKPLNVGTILFIIETRVLFGRVDGYFFGSVTNPHYVVRLVDSATLTPQGTGLSFVEEFTQHIDVEDLYKRFHQPTGYESDYFEEEVEGESNQSVRPSNYYVSQMAHAPRLQYQHFRSRQNTEPNGGAQDNFNQMQYQPMMYQQEYQFMRPETNQHNPNLVQMGSVPNLVHTQAPMMPMTYQQEQQFVRPETNQHNQMSTVPDLFPSQAPIQNQALTMIVSDVVLYLQQYLSEQISKVLQDRQLGSFSVNQNYSNQQQTGLPEPQPEINSNPQTQPTMQPQVFIAGTSSYRGRSGGRGQDQYNGIAGGRGTGRH